MLSNSFNSARVKFGDDLEGAGLFLRFAIEVVFRSTDGLQAMMAADAP